MQHTVCGQLMSRATHSTIHTDMYLPPIKIIQYKYYITKLFMQ